MLGFWLSGYLAWDFPNNFWSLWETLGNEELPTRVGRFHMYSKGNLEDLQICMCLSSILRASTCHQCHFSSSVFGFSVCHLCCLHSWHIWEHFPPYLFGSQGTLHQRFSPTNFWPGAGSWTTGWVVPDVTLIISMRYINTENCLTMMCLVWDLMQLQVRSSVPIATWWIVFLLKQLFFDVVAMEWNKLTSLWEIFSWSSGIVRTVLDLRCSTLFWPSCLRKALFEVASRYLTEWWRLKVVIP